MADFDLTKYDGKIIKMEKEGTRMDVIVLGNKIYHAKMASWSFELDSEENPTIYLSEVSFDPDSMFYNSIVDRNPNLTERKPNYLESLILEAHKNNKKEIQIPGVKIKSSKDRFKK